MAGENVDRLVEYWQKLVPKFLVRPKSDESKYSEKRELKKTFTQLFFYLKVENNEKETRK